MFACPYFISLSKYNVFDQFWGEISLTTCQGLVITLVVVNQLLVTKCTHAFLAY